MTQEEISDPLIIDRILLRMSGFAFAQRLLVFGPAARGAPLGPGSGLDVVIDLRPKRYLEVVSVPASRSSGGAGPLCSPLQEDGPLAAYGPLLAVARRYRGRCEVRPALRFEDRLLVADESARLWLTARGRVQVCEQIDHHGLPIRVIASQRMSALSSSGDPVEHAAYTHRSTGLDTNFGEFEEEPSRRRH